MYAACKIFSGAAGPDTMEGPQLPAIELPNPSKQQQLSGEHQALVASVDPHPSHPHSYLLVQHCPHKHTLIHSTVSLSHSYNTDRTVVVFIRLHHHLLSQVN